MGRIHKGMTPGPADYGSKTDAAERRQAKRKAKAAEKAKPPTQRARAEPEPEPKRGSGINMFPTISLFGDRDGVQ